MLTQNVKSCCLSFVLLLVVGRAAYSQTLESQLQTESVAALATAAKESGDAKRGAIVFFQQHLACSKCHSGDDPQRALGPDLTRYDKPPTDAELVESVLSPSKVLRKGFEAISIVTVDETMVTGLFVEEGDDVIVLRDPAQNGKLLTIPKKKIEQRSNSATSLMPPGQVNQLGSRQQFLDLVRYLIEIRDGGPLRALELKPDPSLIANVTLPEYEQHLDHAGLIRKWNANSLKRGEAIYLRVCANCHGTQEKPGSLPLSPRFADWKAKNGNDPFAMYQTLTRGFGFMVPQTWMVPKQKYDVIHYIRETYLKPRNAAQYAAVNNAYLASLPTGDSLGPEPSNLEPWVVMDYGPSLINTYEIPSRQAIAAGAPPNLAYKGLAMRLDAGPGGVSRGKHWMIFDHDTLRMAGVWSGSGFIDWQGIHFNGQHQVHPQVVGNVHAANPVGPGWANPKGKTGSFDDPRFRGRDGRPYGPLPREWAKFRGFYAYGPNTIVSYSVGTTPVLECSQQTSTNGVSPAKTSNDYFTRSFQIGARELPMTLLVVTVPGGKLHSLAVPGDSSTGEFAPIVFAPNVGEGAADRLLVVGVEPPIAGGKWRTDSAGRLLLDIPAGTDSLQFCLWHSDATNQSHALELASTAGAGIEPVEWKRVVQGGPKRWSQTITTNVIRGSDEGPFAADILAPPDNNPWLAQLRLTGFDFFADGDRAAVCSWDGDVWLVSGVSTQGQLTWQRIGSGLFQPLGLKIIEGVIYVTCRDQIVRLHDFNGDGETDFYECFNNDHQVTEHFHEFAMGLQVDGAGNLYYAKSARHALPAIVPQHGTLLRVSKDGSKTEILANGFRAANGVCLNPDGSFIVTDQEGHWNPKNRINWVTLDPHGPPRFYGNMFGYHDVTDSSDSAMEQPLCWITNSFDRSPAELLWVTSDHWGPLRGSLLNFSYGYGKIFVVPHEEVSIVRAGEPRIQQKQGGMIELPLPAFPTGIHRGRFHPQDGQLYVCGMFAWAGSATQPGGFYRVRYTGRPLHIPVELHATRRGLRLKFAGDLAADSVADPQQKSFAIKTWSLKRTADYGSKHYAERPLTVQAASLASDRRTVELQIPDIAPTWCMEIRYSIRSASGSSVNGVLHNTIHALGDE